MRFISGLLHQPAVNRTSNHLIKRIHYFCMKKSYYLIIQQVT